MKDGERIPITEIVAGPVQVWENGDGRVWLNTTEEQDRAMFAAGLRPGMLVRLFVSVIPCAGCGSPAEVAVAEDS